MDVTPTVPDTELADAEAWFRKNLKVVDALALVDNAAPYQRHAATIVRAYLARLTTGRVLTARDVEDAVSSAPDAADNPGIAMQQHVADFLNRVVCRTHATPPTEDALTTAMKEITEESAASDSILQPGAAFALGCLGYAAEVQPGCMPEHVAAAFRLARPTAESPDPAPWPRDTHPVRQEYEDVVQRVAQELFALHGGPGSVWADLTCELAEGWREQARTVLRGARVPVLVSVEEADDVDW